MLPSINISKSPVHSLVSHHDAKAYTQPEDTKSRKLGSMEVDSGTEQFDQLSSYRILKKLGQGGMGTVLLAEDVLLRRQLAIKVMLPECARDPRARQRFMREARAVARIDHPNIVSIHTVGEDRGIPFIAMELLKGSSLEDLLAQNNKLPIDRIVEIALSIAEGLRAAHDAHLIHRDIKPSNIWIEAPSGRVKILDFGLVRETREESQLTYNGAVLGTPAYMSLEQASGSKVDHRADLFSLGVVLYKMCGGVLPFRGDSMVAILEALALSTPTPLRELNPNVPQALDELVQRLLAKTPAERVQTASEVIQSLKAIQRSLHLNATTVTERRESLAASRLRTSKLPTAKERSAYSVANQAPLAPSPNWEGSNRLLRGLWLVLLGFFVAGGAFTLSNLEARVWSIEHRSE